MTFRPWSYSAWKLFTLCPAAYRWHYVVEGTKKVVESHAMARGTMIHSKAEHFIKGGIRGMPSELKKLAAQYQGLKKAKAICEEWWCVDREWKPVRVKKDPDKHPRSWLRGKTDAYALMGNELVVVDHKTGQIYPEHADQAGVYAVLGHAFFPKVESVTVEFFYTDKGHVIPHTFDLKKLRAARKLWTQRGLAVSGAKTFKATPSPKACGAYGGCPYRSDKGGPCRQWKAT
jgi:hypothetical protein